MMEIRIEMVHGSKHFAGKTFVMLKKLGEDKVQYQEDWYPTCRADIPLPSDPKIITAAEANEIYKRLKKWAKPYVRYNDNEMFWPMKSK